jgi:hypothetical protein
MKKEREEFTAFVRELFLARECLKRCRRAKKCQYVNPGTRHHCGHTWKSYCEEIEIPRELANCWINKLVPREVTPDGKDYYLGSIPPWFTAAIRQVKNQKKKPAAGKTRAAKRRKV